jgi:predicted nucleic acid-binding protein
LKFREPKDESLRGVAAALDRGERSAIALAHEIGADLLLPDDKAARNVARAVFETVPCARRLLRFSSCTVAYCL